jgi:hypothetical protein
MRLGEGAAAVNQSSENLRPPLSFQRQDARKRPRGFAALWLAVNALVIASLALGLIGLYWDYGTHEYLQGFADAIVPLGGSDQEKAKALLKWLAHSPGRIEGFAKGALDERDPVDVLHDTQLLKVCGSTANAFINLAAVSGLKSRRLLLVDDSGGARHVTAEVLLGGRWVVVDPATGSMFTGASGQPLSKEELRDPKVFLDAISRIPGYPRAYSFQRTAYLHLERIPVFGKFLRQALDRLYPGWNTALDWGYLPEHPSLWPVLAFLVLLGFSVPFRALLDWYGRKRLGLNRIRFRDRLARAAQALLLRSPNDSDASLPVVAAAPQAEPSCAVVANLGRGQPER